MRDNIDISLYNDITIHRCIQSMGIYRCHDNEKSDVSPYTEKLIARMSQ
jgi:hypothetical protein